MMHGARRRPGRQECKNQLRQRVQKPWKQPGEAPSQTALAAARESEHHHYEENIVEALRQFDLLRMDDRLRNRAEAIRLEWRAHQQR